MKLKRLAEETDGYTTENMTTFAPEYVTEAKKPGTIHALELVTAAAMQSGLKFLRTVVDEEEGYERIAFDASEAEPSVVMNIIKDLERHEEYSYEFGSQQRNHDMLVISYPFEVDGDSSDE